MHINLSACLFAVLLIIPLITFAQQRTPIEEFVDGFPPNLAKQAHAADLPDLLAGGDEAVYFAARASEFLPTAIVPVRQSVKQLPIQPVPEIGKIKVETINSGTLSLDEYLALPESYLQGFIVISKGKVVYEKYPRMRPEDHHLWMSNAKVTASLVIDLLIDEGKIDEDEKLGKYVAEFRDTPIKVKSKS
jgi:CubicO group peptidase (beta-lactamase class C family)